MRVKVWSWGVGLLLCACGTGGASVANPEVRTDAEQEAQPASAEPAPASGSERYAPPPDGRAGESPGAKPKRRVTGAEDDAFDGASAESLEEESAPARRAEQAPRAESGAAPSDVTPEVLAQRLVQVQEQLDAALSLGQPDCAAALRFRQLVCNLADRICHISDGVDVSQISRCRDGRRRCDQSERAYAERCE